MFKLTRRTSYGELKQRIVPDLRFNQYLYEDILLKCVSTETQWLDAGCGHKLLPTWRAAAERELVKRARFVCGCDGDVKSLWRHESLRYCVGSDLSALPFKSGTFSLITCNMVIEHLENPAPVFKEFARLLKPDGVVIVHTPYRWSYISLVSSCVPQFIKDRIGRTLDGRPEEDYYPVRYRCNTPKKLRLVFSQAGLQEIKMSMFASDAIFQFLGEGLWGTLVIRMELYFLRLSLRPSWWFLRSSICGIYQKCR